MKKTFIVTTFLSSFLLISCNNTSTEDKEKELLKKELELAKKELELNKKESEEVRMKKESNPKKQETTETQIEVVSTDIQEDPVKIMQTIFDVAKTNDFSKLSGLCDPTGSGDGDTKSICNVGTQSPKAQNEFKEYFQNGKIIGTALINGNTASVKFKFGPDGTKEEEMNFTKVGGKWYLSSF